MESLYALVANFYFESDRDSGLNDSRSRRWQHFFSQGAGAMSIIFHKFQHVTTNTIDIV